MANIQRLTEALNAYTGEQDSLMAFAKVAEEELGENWTTVIYDVITPTDDTQKEKLDHVYHYYGATLAWGEVQGYLEQEEPLDLAELSERIPTLEYWLNFFGEQGLHIVNELQDKMRQQALMDEVYKVDEIRKEAARIAGSTYQNVSGEQNETSSPIAEIAPVSAEENELAEANEPIKPMEEALEASAGREQAEEPSEIKTADEENESDETPITMADEDDIFDMEQMPSETWESEEITPEEAVETSSPIAEIAPVSAEENATAETNEPIKPMEEALEASAGREQAEEPSEIKTADEENEADEMPIIMADEDDIFDMEQIPSMKSGSEDVLPEETAEPMSAMESTAGTVSESEVVDEKNAMRLTGDLSHDATAVSSSTMAKEEVKTQNDLSEELPAPKLVNTEESAEKISQGLPEIPMIPTNSQQVQPLPSFEKTPVEAKRSEETETPFPSVPNIPNIPNISQESNVARANMSEIQQPIQPPYNEGGYADDTQQGVRPMYDENGYPYQSQESYNEGGYADDMQQSVQPMYDENGYPYQSQESYNEGGYADDMQQGVQPMYDENGYPYQSQEPYNEGGYVDMQQGVQPMYDENGYPYQSQEPYNEGGYADDTQQGAQPMYDENGYSYQSHPPYNEGVYDDNTQQPYDENAYAYESASYDNVNQTDSGEAYQSNYIDDENGYHYEPGHHDEVGYGVVPSIPVRPMEERSLTTQSGGLSASMPSDEHVRVSSRFQPEKPETNEQFLARKAFKQLDFVNMVHSWMDARCISLGNIEIYTYKHYGFLIDAMEQTRKDIKEVLSSPAYYPAIEATRPNGLQMLQNSLVALEKDLEIAYDNAPSETTALIKDDVNPDEARRMLGMLDTSNKKEYLGPAPDGFEMLDDPFDDTNKV